MENELEFYYEKLKDSTSPTNILLALFQGITGISPTRSEVIMVNKLVKLFGRFTVFFSIVDLSKYEKLEGNVYPLLYTICKNRFESSHHDSSVVAFESLQGRLNLIEKEIEKVTKKKIKVPSPDELE